MDPIRPHPAALDQLRSHIAVIGPDGKIAWVNRAWTQFGQANGATSDSIDCSIDALLERVRGSGSDDAASLLAGLRAVRSQAAESITHAYDCSSPTEYRVFQAQISPAVIEGQSVLLFSHDNITAAIENTRALARLASVQQITHPSGAAAALGSMIGHEMGGPLTALICTLAGIRHTIDASTADPATLRDFVTQAIDHADRARAVLHALRTLTPHHTGPQGRADLAAVVSSVIESVAEDARTAAVGIVQQITTLPTETDPSHAAVILLALIRRAMDEATTRPIGHRTVRVESITTAEHSGIRISVAPRAPEDLHATEHCAASCPTTRPDHSGIGLAARMASDIGGRIEHHPGNTGFTLLLPIARRAVA